MADDRIPYQRLPGIGRSMVGYLRLYRGPDHLLLVESTGYSETYKRFFFRDIQAITLRKTGRQTIWTVVLLILTVPGLAAAATYLASAATANRGAGLAWLVFGLFFGVPLVVNLVRGPTCECRIQTAVQTRTLPSLRRVRRARRVIEQLRPFLDAAQGTLPLEELRYRLEQGRLGRGYIGEAPPVAPAEAPAEAAPEAAPLEATPPAPPA